MPAGECCWQACQQLERVKTLVPDDVSVRLVLGNLLNLGSLPDQALKLVAEIRADPDLRPLGPANEVEVAFLEAKAWFAMTNRPVAQGIIYALLATHPGDAVVLERAVATFTACQSYADALRLTDQQLQLDPNDAVALANKGNLCILTRDFSNAIPPLTLSLSLTNTYGARLNRALAYLRTGRLDAAEADYQHPRTSRWPSRAERVSSSLKRAGPSPGKPAWKLTIRMLRLQRWRNCSKTARRCSTGTFIPPPWYMPRQRSTPRLLSDLVR